MKILKTFIPFLLLIMILFSCRSKSVIERMDYDTPWNSEKSKADQICERYYYYMAAGATSDCYWATISGNRLDLKSTKRKIEDYFEKHGFLEAWPYSNSNVGDITLKTAPYDITVVSIEPLIVIMAESDAKNGIDSFRSSLSPKYINNQIYFGTKIPLNNKIIVLNIDRKLCLELEMVNSPTMLTIDLKDCLILLSQKKRIGLSQDKIKRVSNKSPKPTPTRTVFTSKGSGGAA